MMLTKYAVIICSCVGVIAAQFCSGESPENKGCQACETVANCGTQDWGQACAACDAMCIEMGGCTTGIATTTTATTTTEQMNQQPTTTIATTTMGLVSYLRAACAMSMLIDPQYKQNLCNDKARVRQDTVASVNLFSGKSFTMSDLEMTLETFCARARRLVTSVTATMQFTLRLANAAQANSVMASFQDPARVAILQSSFSAAMQSSFGINVTVTSVSATLLTSTTTASTAAMIASTVTAVPNSTAATASLATMLEAWSSPLAIAIFLGAWVNA